MKALLSYIFAIISLAAFMLSSADWTILVNFLLCFGFMGLALVFMNWDN